MKTQQQLEAELEHIANSINNHLYFSDCYSTEVYINKDIHPTAHASICLRQHCIWLEDFQTMRTIVNNNGWQTEDICIDGDNQLQLNLIKWLK